MNELELDNYHGIDELINELHTRGHDWLREQFDSLPLEDRLEILRLLTKLLFAYMQE